MIGKAGQAGKVGTRRAGKTSSGAHACAVTLLLITSSSPAWAQSGTGAGAGARATPPLQDLATAEATTVSATPERRTLVLGSDTGTNIRVDVVGPAAAGAVPGRTRATVGLVGSLVATSTPGHFTLEYRAPAERRPQSALVAVEVILPGGTRVHATTQIMLPAATNFPFHSSPSANVSLEVAGRVFGPERADGEGNVTVGIVVPPGVPAGRARAENRFGVTKETDVGLQLMDYPRVLMMAPPDADAGRPVNVAVYAVDPSGDPSLPEDVDLRVSSGKVRRLGGVPGIAQFEVTLPEQIGAGAVALVAAMDDGSSVRPDTIVVHAGPLARLTIAADPPRLVVGGATASRVTVVAADQFGNPLPANGVALFADGRPLAVEGRPEGARAAVGAPDLWQGRDRVVVTAELGAVHSSLDLGLTGGEPARVVLSAQPLQLAGNGKSSVDLVLEVFDERGTPTLARRVAWQTEEDAAVESLPSPRLGTYLARLTPVRALRNHTAVVTATVDHDLGASVRIAIEPGTLRTAAARVGIASNLGSLFGPAAFVETTMSLGRIGRLGRLGHLLSAGLAVGYLHTELTTSPAATFSAVHVDISQTPLLALARVRVPGDLPVEISLSGAAGMTFVTTTLAPTGDSPFGASHASARGLVIGGGADASVLLSPGELIVGARYLRADLGRDSNGDQLEGNALGLVCDLGFRIGF